MKLDAIKFGLAGVLSTAILWIVCSAFVAFFPDMMWSMTEHMMHMDFQSMGHDMTWTLTTTGFVTGLIVWPLSAGIFLWLIATIYNYFDKQS